MDLLEERLQWQTKKDQLKELLLREARQRRPGERIMPELDLATSYKVSRDTVRRTIKELVAEGVLESRNGVGTFVSGKRTEIPAVALVHELLLNPFTHTCHAILFRALGHLANNAGYDFSVHSVINQGIPLETTPSHDLPTWRELGNQVLMSKLRESKIHGLVCILAPYRNLDERLGEAGCPHVIIGDRGARPRIQFDFRTNAITAITHLRAIGCTKLLCVSIHPWMAWCGEVAERFGLTIVEDLAKVAPGAYDGVYFDDDYNALQNLEWIRSFGNCDRIVVFQNEVANFPLPTVAMVQPVSRLAAAVWEMLKCQIDGNALAEDAVLIPGELRLSV